MILTRTDEVRFGTSRFDVIKMLQMILAPVKKAFPCVTNALSFVSV